MTNYDQNPKLLHNRIYSFPKVNNKPQNQKSNIYNIQETYLAATVALLGVIQMCKDVWEGKCKNKIQGDVSDTLVDNGICLVRPPG